MNIHEYNDTKWRKGERAAVADLQLERHLGRTAMRTTPELREGDVVRNHGARVKLVREQVRRPCCEGFERYGEGYGHCRPEDGHGELVSFLGIVLNPDDPDAADLVSLARGERGRRERNGQWCPEGDEPIWIVQGNAMASWSVEI